MPELSYAVPSSMGELHKWNITAENGHSTAPPLSQISNGGNFALGAATASVKAAPQDSSLINRNGNGNNKDADTSPPKDSGDHGNETERCIWVLDPLTRKLRVPLSQLVHTQATATAGTVPSLCISFLEGRCRHQWCRQAHVLPSAIPQLRYEALHAPTCCRVHDDPHDTSVLTSRFKYIRVVNNGSNGGADNSNNNNKQNANANVNNDTSDLIHTDRVAQTVGLLRFMAHSVPPPKKKQHQHSSSKERNSTRGGESANATGDAENGSGKNTNGVADDGREEVLELPAKLICRLHLAHRCRYLEDCNNIHICREYELRLQPPPQVMAALSSVAPATRTITIGDTCYAITPLSLGDVTDEAFRVICEQQRQALHVPQWRDTPSIAPHRSPMIYGGGGGGGGASPLTLGAGVWSTTNNNNSGSAGGPPPFPAHPDNGHSGSNSPVAPGSLPGQSPISVQPTARVLRIYDVRPKVNHPSPPSGNNNNSSSNNATTNGSSNSNNNNNNNNNNNGSNIAKNYMGGNSVRGNSNGGGGPKYGGGRGGNHHHGGKHGAAMGAENDRRSAAVVGGVGSAQ
ncbi:hypothetical protein DQ04_01421050 [Trypanosoma grayi]|uniref:hypothetical protein n=1 Tax=Trypanosoma grayi TaxID=71804 RepID=UPI0004F45820|nr:hypothetical protein DQ04_01421050 [Trypanosoma grayi]KEG12791.1 hypothetical protein DQ04_01421050 [Trypanosoma grayi]